MKILGKYGLFQRLVNCFQVFTQPCNTCGQMINTKKVCPSDGWPGSDFGRSLKYELKNIIPFKISFWWNK